jgi:hypothetical protein
VVATRLSVPTFGPGWVLFFFFTPFMVDAGATNAVLLTYSCGGLRRPARSTICHDLANPKASEEHSFKPRPERTLLVASTFECEVAWRRDSTGDRTNQRTDRCMQRRLRRSRDSPAKKLHHRLGFLPLKSVIDRKFSRLTFRKNFCAAV